VPRGRSVIEVDDDDVRSELSAFSLLIVVVPPGHANHARAEAFNAALHPARECAREALRSSARDVRSSPALRSAQARCWELIDRAAPEFDSGFVIDPTMTVRAWAERRVDALLAAGRRRADD
jgi:hypothetical protein